MSNEKNIRIVRGVSKFAGSVNKDISLQPLLSSDERTLIQGDRNLVLNLADQFDFERDYCTTYRMYGKIDILYNNVISGETSDSNFLGYMYFKPDYLGCPDPVAYPTNPSAGPPCVGMPPAMTFDFIPPTIYGDNAASSTYSVFSAYTDNWILYMSYISHSNDDEPMQFYTEYSTPSYMDFIASDGIPFTVETLIDDAGRETVRFTTPVPHGVSPGEYIELQPTPTTQGNANLMFEISLTYTIPSGTWTTQQNLFKVDSLGNEFANSEEYVININTVGLNPTSIVNNPVGTLKRIINPDNLTESRSNYYCHQHKLITQPNDYTLDRTGFEVGVYNKKGRVFKAKKTPATYPGTTTILEEFKSYTWVCTLDIDVDSYYDNHNRPLTDLYLSIFPTNRNLMWHYNGAGSPAGYGWDWNFRKIGVIDPFVDNDTNPSNVLQNTTSGVSPLPASGSTFRGAFVEYNLLELKERIISELGYSLKFNKNVIYEVGTASAPEFIKSIYKYRPHNRIPIKKLSNSIRHNDSLFTSPQYSVYSLVDNTFRWRPILPIEFYDDEVNGVSYPYLNDAHYPHHNLEFIIEPILHNYTAETINILSTFIDDCE